MREHIVKIDHEFAEAHQNGFKPWELRKNDRGYKVGDFIIFEVMKNGQKLGEYRRKITYIFNGGKFGLENDHVIMTIIRA